MGFKHVFKICLGEVFEAGELRKWVEEDLAVLSGVTWHNSHLVSDDAFCPWVRFSQTLPTLLDDTPEENHPKALKTTLGHESRQFLHDNPWLLHGRAEVESPHCAEGRQHRSKRARCIDPVIDDETKLAAAWEDFMQQQHEHFTNTMSAAEHHFGTFLRGGRWTMAVQGVSVDVIGAKPLTEDANQFCKETGVGRMVSFSIQKYTREWALFLAEVWCQKCVVIGLSSGMKVPVQDMIM